MATGAGSSRLPVSRLRPPTNFTAKSRTAADESSRSVLLELNTDESLLAGPLKDDDILKRKPLHMSSPTEKKKRGSIKRSQSPTEAPNSKRQRLNPSNTTTNLGTTLRPSASTSRLNNTKSKATTSFRSTVSTSRITPRPASTSVASRATKPSISRSTRPAARPTTSNVKPTNTSTVNRRGAPLTIKDLAPPTARPTSPKRKSWDYKGQLEDSKARLKATTVQMDSLRSTMQSKEERITNLEQSNKELSAIREEVEKKIAKLKMEKTRLEEELKDSQITNKTLLKRATVAETQLDEAIETISEKKKEIRSLNIELETKKETISMKDEKIQEKDIELRKCYTKQTEQEDHIKYQQEHNKMLQGIVDEQRRDILESERTRKQLHNTIQELKGNIRVFCRVRPLLGDELTGSTGDIGHMSFPDDKVIELSKLDGITVNESTFSASRKGNNKYPFSFDRVFGPSSNQDTVFEEIEQLVQSVLDGYNCCIFAYGQTGSGKTYTMEGPSGCCHDSSHSTRGMIPRSVLRIFDQVKELKKLGWEYSINATFLEIYNETIRDLLGNSKDEKKHEVRMVGKDTAEVYVSDITPIPIENEPQLRVLLDKASKNRSVGETLLNERSSRSHYVFQLTLTGNNEITQEKCRGTLNLVDLAGSEKLKESGATGVRLEETKNINKSLSALGNVIMALGKKDSHIPYRNSKLTHMLQNSLGGNSKTLMFVNISPREEHFAETLNSLRFASKVNQCHIGTATKRLK